MTVYVDDFYKSRAGKLGRMRMSHMVADTRQELLEMADAIGVDRKHIQSRYQYSEHFDICMSKRREAIARGAVALTSRELVKQVLRPRRLKPAILYTGATP